MSTSKPETETDAEEDSAEFSIDEIRWRLPGHLTSKQQRAAICMVRNPDASLKDIGDNTAVSSNTVLEALRGLAFGVGTGSNHSTDLAEVFAKREGHNMAETFDQLTDKQKAVVDWLARREGTLSKLLDGDNDNLTGPMVADAVASNEEYDVAVSNSYPIRVVQEYGSLVEERREQLALEGDLGDEDEEVETVKGRRPREVLASAGVDLPESNLDSLDLGDALTEQQRLDAAYDRANSKRETEPVTEEDREQYTAPYGCPSCGHQEREDFCSKCGHDKRYEDAKEDASGSDEAEEETPDHAADLTAGDAEESEEEPERDLSDELDQPLVDSPEALTDALNGLTERLEEHERALDTLRESAVTEDEVESILNNFEERMRAALETHRETTVEHVEEELLDEVMDEVDHRLHNSVKADLKRKVEELEEYMAEHPTDAEANGRLGLVLDELTTLAESGAEVSGLEVNERRHSREYVLTVDTGDASESMTTEDAEVSR